MNQNLTYSRLLNIYQNVKPIRGTNRFPFWYRSHTWKYFTAKEINNELVFEVNYGWTWMNKLELSDADFHAQKNSMGKRELSRWQKDSDTNTWYKYLKQDRPLGLVYPDNTFEFTMNSLGQGDRYILSSWNNKHYLKHDVKMGGCVAVVRHLENKPNKIIPLFVGMRVCIDTFEPHENSRYELKVKKLNRVKAKETFNLYKDKLSLARTFIKTMDNRTLQETADETMKSCLDEDNTWYRWWDISLRERVLDKLHTKLDTDPVGVIAGYMKALRVNWGNLDVNYHNTEQLFNMLIPKLRKYIYIKNKTFDVEVKPHTESIKQSDWGTDVYVNNQLVKRIR